MSAKVFVDTNVLVYCRDASEPEKQAQTAAWMAALWEQQTGLQLRIGVCRFDLGLAAVVLGVRWWLSLSQDC